MQVTRDPRNTNLTREKRETEKNGIRDPFKKEHPNPMQIDQKESNL